MTTDELGPRRWRCTDCQTPLRIVHDEQGGMTLACDCDTVPSGSAPPEAWERR